MRWPFRRKSSDRIHFPYVSGGIERVPARSNALRREVESLHQELVAQGADPDSLTAAGQRVLNGQATLLRRLIQPWQIRAFGYYDLLGEINYASQFYSRSLSNLRLYVAEIDESGELKETDDKDAVEALSRIKDPGGAGRTGLLSAYGRLMFLTGETYLFVTVDPETEVEQWEMLSTDEIRLNDGLYTRFKAPSLPAHQFAPAPDDQYVLAGAHPDATKAEREKGEIEYDGSLPEAVAYRLWRRHPRFSDLADSTMKGVLELCEELVLLTQAVRARARSRLAGSGVLFLDDRITTKPLAPSPDEDPLDDPFIADLTMAMTSPIVDEGTAAAVVPLVARVRVPDNMRLADLVYHLQIIDPMQVYPETGLRTECIHRIAIGLDMPSDILEGMTDANHWTAWMVDEQSWKAHLQPVAQQLVEDLTSAYLGPYLRVVVGRADWARFVVAYDAAEVINHPDRTKDAGDGYAAGVISAKSYRDTLGFTDDDAPGQKEHNEWLGVRLRDSSVAIYGIPSLRSGGVEPTAGEVVTGDTGGGDGSGGAAPGDGESAAAAEKLPPEKPDSPPAEGVVGAAGNGRYAAELLVARIEGAAVTALVRARESAGARIRSLGRNDDEVCEAIDGIPNRNVAATLGPATVRRILGGPKEAEVVASSRLLIEDALGMVGVGPGFVRDQIVEKVESHALRTLYDEKTVLNGTFPGYVLGLLSGGVGGG